MIVEAKNMKTEELIGALVELDKQGKENRALTNAYKAELQARGISIMDDHNVKYVKFYGDAGSAAITDSMSLDILNPEELKAFRNSMNPDDMGFFGEESVDDGSTED